MRLHPALAHLAGIMLLAGCAAQAPLRAVTDAATPLEFHGFSLLPPPGPNWYFGPQDSYGVTLGKLDPARSGEASHTFYVRARLFRAEGARIDTPGALNQAFTERYLSTLTDGRFRLVEARVVPYRAQETDCLRYDVVQEERDNPKLPGSLLILTDHGFQCRHPNSPQHIVHVYYSARQVHGQRSPLDAERTREAEAFLHSVQFVPLNQRFDDLVNCVAGGQRQWTRRSKCD